MLLHCLSIAKDSKTKGCIQVVVEKLKLQYNYLAQHFIKVATKIHYKLIPTVACIQELQNASLQTKKLFYIYQ